MPEKVTVNCIKCRKSLKFSRNCLKIQVCQKQINLKCSRLNKQGFLKYKRDSASFICQFCLDYCCLQCNKCYGQKVALCSGCDSWIHQKCANYPITQFFNFLESNNSSLVSNNSNLTHFVSHCSLCQKK